MATNRYQVESGFLIALSEAARMAAYNRENAYVFQEEGDSGVWEFSDRKPRTAFFLVVGPRGTVEPPSQWDTEPVPSTMETILSARRAAGMPTPDPTPWDGS